MQSLRRILKLKVTVLLSDILNALSVDLTGYFVAIPYSIVQKYQGVLYTNLFAVLYIPSFVCSGKQLSHIHLFTFFLESEKCLVFKVLCHRWFQLHSFEQILNRLMSKIYRSLTPELTHREVSPTHSRGPSGCQPAGERKQPLAYLFSHVGSEYSGNFLWGGLFFSPHPPFHFARGCADVVLCNSERLLAILFRFLQQLWLVLQC